MKRFIALVSSLFGAQYTDTQIEVALSTSKDYALLYLAVSADQGIDGMIFGFDTWWRLCRGGWTRAVQGVLPGLTDAQLLAFLKRYAAAHRHESGRDLLRRLEKHNDPRYGVVVPPGGTL